VIYLDSCIVIYSIEGTDDRAAAIRQRMANAGDTVLAISPLVVMECLVGPLISNDFVLHDHYQRAFSIFQMLDLGVAQFERAANLRASHGLKVQDAIHLATAQLSGCDELWTNDTRLAMASAGLAVDASGT